MHIIFHSPWTHLCSDVPKILILSVIRCELQVPATSGRFAALRRNLHRFAARQSLKIQIINFDFSQRKERQLGDASLKPRNAIFRMA